MQKKRHFGVLVLMVDQSYFKIYRHDARHFSAVNFTNLF
jgi:hypothetical protein